MKKNNRIEVEMGHQQTIDINPDVLVSVLGYEEEKFSKNKIDSSSVDSDGLIRMINRYKYMRENDSGVMIVSGKGAHNIVLLSKDFHTERGSIKMDEHAYLVDMNKTHLFLDQVKRTHIKYDLMIFYLRDEITVYSNGDFIYSRNLYGIADYLMWGFGQEEMLEDIVRADVFERIINDHVLTEDYLIKQLSLRFIDTMKTYIEFPIMFDCLDYHISDAKHMSFLISKLIQKYDISLWDLPFHLALIYGLGDEK